MWRRLALCPPLQGQDGGLWRAVPKLPSASPSWALKWEAWELPSLFSTAICISSLWIPDTFTVHTMQAAPALPPCFGLFPCVWRAPEIELAHQDKSAIWSVRAWTQTPPLPFPDPVFISWHHYFPALKLGWTFRDELATVSGLGECLALWVRHTHSKERLRVINNLLVKLGHLGEWKQLTRVNRGCPGLTETHSHAAHTPVFLPGEFCGQRSLGYSSWCHKESDTTEQLTPPIA